MCYRCYRRTGPQEAWATTKEQGPWCAAESAACEYPTATTPATTRTDRKHATADPAITDTHSATWYLAYTAETDTCQADGQGAADGTRPYD